MIDLASKENCNGCTACISICPKNCIQMVENDEGFKYPKINLEICVKCHKCENVCPELNIPNINKSNKIFLKLKNKDDNIRYNSSSGGFFYSIAKYFLENENTYVFGAVLDSSFTVRHLGINNVDELLPLCKSKYVQSNLDGIFNQIKKKLTLGNYVLFVGTPCQISGLINYLGKEYKNLITIDFVCHGVPSDKVWKGYLDSLEKKYNDKIKNIFFRDKRIYGWKEGGIGIELFKHTINEQLNNNSYLIGFNKSLYLRSSCYNCSFKGISRSSDLTMLDLWGVEHYDEKFDDNIGCSGLIIQSTKGKKYFDFIKNEFFLDTLLEENLIEYNSQIVKSAIRNKKRKQFFQEFNLSGFEKAYLKTYKDSKISVFSKKIRTYLEIMKRKITK